MDYIYLVVATVALGLQSVTNAYYQRFEKNASPFFFTLLLSATMGVFFFFVNGCTFVWNGETVIYGTIIAVTGFSCNICTYKAFETGKVSLTALMLSYSLIIPTLFGLIYYHDELSVTFLIAAAVLALSLFLISKSPKNESERSVKSEKIRPIWVLFVVIAFVANGSGTVAQTLSQKATGGLYPCELMMVACFWMLALSAVFLAFKKGLPDKEVRVKAVAAGVGNGVTQGLCNLFVMLLTAGTMPVSLIFPIISAGSVIINYCASRFVFREKLTTLQNVGFVLGIIAVILFNI